MSWFSGQNPTAIDLAADQCTLYLAVYGSTRIGRFDVCTGTPLSDLTSSFPDSSVTTIRILPDGSILVAARLAIYRIDGSGSILQTYSLANREYWAGLAVDPGGTSFRSSTYAVLTQFSLAGETLRTLNSGPITSLAIVGEPRVGTLPPLTVPALQPLALLCLAAALALVALLRGV